MLEGGEERVPLRQQRALRLPPLGRLYDRWAFRRQKCEIRVHQILLVTYGTVPNRAIITDTSIKCTRPGPESPFNNRTQQFGNYLR